MINFSKLRITKLTIFTIPLPFVAKLFPLSIIKTLAAMQTSFLHKQCYTIDFFFWVPHVVTYKSWQAFTNGKCAKREKVPSNMFNGRHTYNSKDLNMWL
jgi:hypothetical protein